MSVYGHKKSSQKSSTSSRYSSSSYNPSRYHPSTHQDQICDHEQKRPTRNSHTHYSKTTYASHKNTSSRDPLFCIPVDDINYNIFQDTLRDSSSNSLNSFPDHFNQRYSALHESKNKSKNGGFHYLNNAELLDLHDDEWLLYANDEAVLTNNSARQQNIASTRSVPGHINSRNVKNKKIQAHCHQCGAEYPVPTAKFCCECGFKRSSSNSHQLESDRYLGHGSFSHRD